MSGRTNLRPMAQPLASAQVESLLIGAELMANSGQVARVDIDAIHKKPMQSRDWLATRMQRFEDARRYLQQRGVLVSVANREAMVRRYRVTGKREPFYAEDVIELAIAHGMETDG